MSLPFEPEIFGYPLNIHLILEYLAFFFAIRYYLYLRQRSKDAISTQNRLSIILGACIGAFLGSRLMGYLEDPLPVTNLATVISLFNIKTIMGGLAGGLAGVEIAKKIIGERLSSGDLFTLPIILGIFVGRLGCFLNGTREFTYGIPTNSILGIDLGDGLKRHPLALYELIFLLGLFLILRYSMGRIKLRSGDWFKIFMLSYFAFRFMIEFLKPNTFYIASLSSIQWLCLLCICYYVPSLNRWIFYANKKVRLL